MNGREIDGLFGWTGDDGDGHAGRLCVVGAPHDGGNTIRRGADRAPEAIRRASLSHAPPRVAGMDWGDVAPASTGDFAGFLASLASATARAHARGLVPLVIGGDHAITFAVVSSLRAAGDLCLVWFDAHTDFSPWSGHAAHNHKQVLRRIVGLEFVRRAVQIGYRGITTGDERNLDDKTVVVTSAQARRLDPRALLALVPDQMPCYVSIDIDVIDPLWAQGTGAPVPDGLPPGRLRDLLRHIVHHRRVVGVDLVEVNPAVDAGAETSHVAAGLLHAIADDWIFQLARQSQCKDTQIDRSWTHHGPHTDPHL